MASYAVDSKKQKMTATGIVDPIKEWEETPDGKRRPSDKQARNDETGMPLWAVEVLYVQTNFGRRSTATAKVTVDAPEEPSLAPLSSVEFTGLRVETRVNKAGGLVESWTADGLADAPKATARTSGEKAA
jgi:hypothetical protein